MQVTSLVPKGKAKIYFPVAYAEESPQLAESLAVPPSTLLDQPSQHARTRPTGADTSVGPFKREREVGEQGRPSKRRPPLASASHRTSIEEQEQTRWDADEETWADKSNADLVYSAHNATYAKPRNQQQFGVNGSAEPQARGDFTTGYSQANQVSDSGGLGQVSTKTKRPSRPVTQPGRSGKKSSKPRWHTQMYIMFLALRQMPGHEASRSEIIHAAVELDKKISEERGLPRVFTGKTPMNSASACLTNNGDKYFIPFKPPGARSMHFRLSYTPSDFKEAVKEYDRWNDILIQKDWPICFGQPENIETNADNTAATVPGDTVEPTAEPTLELPSGDPKPQSTPQTNGARSTPTGLTHDSVADGTQPEINTESSALTTAEPQAQISDPVKSAESAPKEENTNEPLGTTPPPNVDSVSTGDDCPTVMDVDNDCPTEPEIAKNGAPKNPAELKGDQTVTSSVADVPPTNEGDVQSCTVPVTSKSDVNTNPSPLQPTAKVIPTTSTTDATTKESTDPIMPVSEPDPSPAVIPPTPKVPPTAQNSDIPKSWRDVVEVKPSTIPNAGQGLFAIRDLPAYVPLGFYFGVPMTEDEFDSLKDHVGLASHYSIMYRRTVLDATDSNGQPFTDPDGLLFCPFHFMNEKIGKGNVAFLEGYIVNQVICMTTRKVKAGEELFVYYGSEVDREHWNNNLTTSQHPQSGA
ncbi:hypothetical protein IWQ62_004902 [Dispira parvispora]|uniref:SET domain-containing protein n=1 Tax=Dispira parvispora TaxID=1520584 RepID=A0A9W8ART3_9FUNG|nr:hypothetical protein IWQ62_004902 [Dispira parvispora]